MVGGRRFESVRGLPKSALGVHLFDLSGFRRISSSARAAGGTVGGPGASPPAAMAVCSPPARTPALKTGAQFRKFDPCFTAGGGLLALADLGGQRAVRHHGQCLLETLEVVR